MYSLQKLCEISLMRDYLLLQDVKNVPYRLIKNVLMKVKKEHLCKLENNNVLLIFEDDELWLNFLKQDFPTSVHDSYVSKKDTLKQYYLDFIERNDSKLTHDDPVLINSYIQTAIRKDPLTKKYKLPYRLLYFKYQQDVEKKQEQSAERLRLQMKKLEMERQQNQTVTVDHLFYEKNQPKKSSRNMCKSRHSDLFKKSIKEHENRLQHFKSGGFDIAKRRPTRIAFAPNSPHSELKDGTSKDIHEAGNPVVAKSEIDRLESELRPITSQPKPHSPQKPKKRRSEPPSIFLQRKRPILTNFKDKISKPEVPQGLTTAKNIKTEVARTKQPIVSGHKKKSSLFSKPVKVGSDNTSAENREHNHKQSARTNIYIFDVTKS